MYPGNIQEVMWCVSNFVILERFRILLDKYDGYSIKLLFYDTIGLDDFEHVNSQFEKVADIYLLCFALDDRQSFLDLVKYIRQLNSIKGLPLNEKVVFLVGTKSDSFECENSKSVSGNDLKSIQRDVKRKISVKQNSVISTPSENPKIEFLPLSQGISSNSSLVQKRIKQEESEKEYSTVFKGGIKLPYPIPKNQTPSSPQVSISTSNSESSLVDQDETSLIQQLKNETKKSHTRQRSSSTGSLQTNSSSNSPNSGSLLRPPHPTRTFDNKPRILTETLVSPRIQEQQQQLNSNRYENLRNVDRTYAVSSEEISSFLSKYPLISGYIECSSKDGTNINQIFTEVLKIYYKRMKIEKLGKDENCLLM